jgi:hypothetical protein
MLPHDELCHVGVRGMKWGVRRQQARAEKFEQKAAEQKGKIGTIARGMSLAKDANGNTYTRVGDIHRINKAIQKHNKYIDKSNKAKDYVKRSQEKVNRVAPKAFDKPMRPQDRQRHTETYNRVLAKRVGIGVATGVAAALVVPTAKVFGDALARYVAKKTIDKALGG